MSAKPQLHTLYRFWTAAAEGEEVDQEWDGWWSGRNWHALFDMGVWDPQFVVRWELLSSQIEAAVSVVRADLVQAIGERDAALAEIEEVKGHRTWWRKHALLSLGRLIELGKDDPQPRTSAEYRQAAEELCALLASPSAEQAT